MTVHRKPGQYALWIALAVAASLSACNNDTAASSANPAPTKSNPLGPVIGATITPIDVTRIDLGTSVNPDGTISKPTATFKPTDTVYAAVTTERPGHDIVLKARWVFQDDSVIKEVTKIISPADTLVTDFQVTSATGWPTGRYKVQVYVYSQMAAVTEYAVSP